MTNPEIFDRALRRMRRDRAARRGAADFIRGHIVEELIERLALVTRAFADVLELGASDDNFFRPLRAMGLTVTSLDPGALNAGCAGGVQADEDRLPFPPGSFDLIVSAGGLDQVNDLPGALVQIRRALRPDGLFLAGFVGAGSLPVLRDALRAAEAAGTGGASPRLHPQIDVRAMGDLLQRAGFALPVVDGDRLAVRYSGLGGLIADIRAAAAANLLHARDRRPFTRMQAAAAHAAFRSHAGPDGRVAETLELVYALGWAPGPDQPQPARRGSGAVSLAEALKP